ncbi:MAG: glycoside hydrolase family protein [Rhodoferax sp.]
MADNRSFIAALVLSAAALVGIAVDEGYSSSAYPDPVHGTKVPTIGFGTTAGVHMGDTITPVKALERKLSDVRQFEGAIKDCVKVPLHQYEYDAYVNLAYNIGAGKQGVADGFCWSKRGGYSTLVQRLNAQDYTGACEGILMWKRVGDVDCSAPGNKTCSGLWERRKRLRRQCLGEVLP